MKRSFFLKIKLKNVFLTELKFTVVKEHPQKLDGMLESES